MTYTKKFNPAKFTHLEETFKTLLDLSPGEKLTVGGVGVESLHSTRWLIYDWLYHMGMNKKFKISEREGELVIIRKGGAIPTLRRETPTLKQLEPLLEEMLGSKDASLWLREARREERITAEEMGILLDRYNKVMK